MTCECGLLHEPSSGSVGCHECGATCCPSCALDIDSRTYCRWCATSVVAPA